MIRKAKWAVALALMPIVAQTSSISLDSTFWEAQEELTSNDLKDHIRSEAKHVDPDLDLFWKMVRNSKGKSPFIQQFKQEHSIPSFEKGRTGEPLFLTPLIKQGKIEEAQQVSKVDKNISVVPSHSGFLTVREETNSNLFFWYFPAAYDAQNAPLVLWLQGGPGGSSMFGLFVEHGPYFVDEAKTLNIRPTSWNIPYNVLYIDQPAGTGFSFTDKEAGYANNMDDVAKDLYEALQQFYKLFPHLMNNEFYVTGESYAGKYVPAISYKIHIENKRGTNPRIPFKGLAIGDGLCDPINQLDYADFLYETGLLDKPDTNTIMKFANQTKENILAKNWKVASDAFGAIIDFFSKETQLNFYYNYLLSEQPAAFNYYLPWLQQAEVRKAIHVGDLKYEDISMTVHNHLYNDMPKSIKPWLEELLDSDYKVMIYNGQLDVIVAYPLAEDFIRKLEWHGAKKFKDARRLVWKVENDVAGYVREVGNFRQVMVRNAGHILPYDKPKWAFDMIQRFIRGKSFG